MAGPSGSSPPASLNLFDLLNRLRGAEPQYNYAESRLSRGPMIFAKDQDQYNQLHNDRSYGGTFESVSPLNYSPLAGPVRSLLKSTGQPVSVIAPEQTAVAGPGGHLGSDPNTVLHESTHQFMGAGTVPLSIFYSQIPPAIQGSIRQELTRRGYSPDQFGSEIPARLVSGQFDTLGLSPEQGRALRQKYLELYQQVNSAKAQRLRDYTRTPANAPDLPQLMKLLAK